MQVSDRIKARTHHLPSACDSERFLLTIMEIFFSASGMQAGKFHTSLHFYEQNPQRANLHINTDFDDVHGP